MPRRLKVFQTHIGFYDEVVAAPSMKAASQAWGGHVRMFAQGSAHATQDPEAVAAALAQPGIVLKRPHGTSGAYKAEPDPIPTPKMTKAQKERAAKIEQDHKKKQAAEKRARAAADRQAAQQAAEELASIAREEAALRQRRQLLQKKYHLAGG